LAICVSPHQTERSESGGGGEGSYEKRNDCDNCANHANGKLNFRGHIVSSEENRPNVRDYPVA
jgi:hypothetical protein